MIDADNEGDEHIYIKVGGGCHLGINPDDFIQEEDKKSSLSNSFNYQIDSWGYSLPILGGKYNYYHVLHFSGQFHFNCDFDKLSENVTFFEILGIRVLINFNKIGKLKQLKGPRQVLKVTII